MASNPNLETQTQTGAAAAEEVSVDDFSALLNREFKPKSDEAKSRVELAVRTLAEQALSGSSVMPGDVLGTIESMISSIDRKLTEQVNLVLHHPDYPGAGERVARAAVHGDEHRDLDRPQDQGHEHVQGRAAQDVQQLPRRGVGPEPAVQEGLRGRVRSVGRSTLWLPGRRLLLQPAGDRRRGAGGHGEGGERKPRAIHLGHVAGAVRHGRLAGSV